MDLEFFEIAQLLIAAIAADFVSQFSRIPRALKLLKGLKRRGARF